VPRCCYSPVLKFAGEIKKVVIDLKH